MAMIIVFGIFINNLAMTNLIPRAADLFRNIGSLVLDQAPIIIKFSCAIFNFFPYHYFHGGFN